MSAGRKQQQYQIVSNLQEAGRHDPDFPAMMPIPGHLVKPLMVLLLELVRAGGPCRLARGIELQLLGLAAPDVGLIQSGISEAIQAAETETPPREKPDLEVLREATEHMTEVETSGPKNAFVIELPPESLPSWTVIGSPEDLKEHDPFDPAFLLIPPALVPGIWTLIRALTSFNDTGELCRGIEGFLVGLAEPDTRAMVSGLNQAVKAMNRLILTAQEMISDDELIERACEDDEDALLWDASADDDEPDEGPGNGHGPLH